MTRVPPVLSVSRQSAGTTLRSSRALQSVVLAFGLAALRLANPERPLPIDLCVFKSLSGWPCPTCGLTRAVCYALRGDWAVSLDYHPAGMLVAAGLIGWMLWSIAEALRGRVLGDTVRHSVSMSLITVGAVLSIVGWIARFALGT